MRLRLIRNSQLIKKFQCCFLNNEFNETTSDNYLSWCISQHVDKA